MRTGSGPPRAARLATSCSAALALIGAVLLGGCRHLGPKSIAVDRFDYGSAIGESWKQQTLLNIVRLRYLDLPVFVDVASIVAGYSLETEGSVGGELYSPGLAEPNLLALGVAGKFTDRPTITYVPLTGERFLRGLFTPIHPRSIFSMLQSGYAADFVLGLTVESLNGVRNRSANASGARMADPEFLRVLELLREVQAEGGVGLRLQDDREKSQTALLFFRREGLGPDVGEKVAEIRRILGLAADRDRFVLVYSPVRGSEDELAVNSRSMLQVMAGLASCVEVPEAHLKDQSAVPPSADGPAGEGVWPFRIHSGKDRPAGAFTAVRYRDHWFWVDDGDLVAKRAFTSVIYFFTLMDTGETGRLPLVTIPAQ